MGLSSRYIRVFYVERTLPSEELSVARILAGITQSKKSTPPCNAFDDIGWCADAHQIAWTILRRERFDCLDDRIHDLCRLPDGKSADAA